ncbi:hypothetical protein ACFQ4C_17970 [Larkinella insperata]|uniref:Phage protein n=1 Tax=Larkinella insperata TaxID=332158 RepID=A0ABW3Q8P0_9BACT|nr:hypothetical protein [Larkinella insperata]
MTSQEIIDRLEAEGISNAQIIEDGFPEWVGKVVDKRYEHRNETEDEFENETQVYHLVDHNVFLMIDGTKENGQWNYWGLRECRQVSVIEYV